MPAPETRPVSPPAAEIVVTPLDPRPDALPADGHIALLLPLRSRDFSRAAEMVREGFEAAAALQADQARSIKVYPTDNEGDALLAAYQQATAAGARCIVAGVTRDGAAAIAASAIINVPTLVLNSVERGQIPSAPFYTLSLSLDDEARQLARLIAGQGRRRAALLAGPMTLSKRVRDAFEQEWLAAGGEISAKIDISRDPAQYSKLRAALQSAEVIFIAAESAVVRQLRPYIATGVPMYATSQAYDGRATPGANVDLQDIRFIDMPWLVEPAHAAVAVYPRSSKPVSADLDRLYALGIDAYRLAHLLAASDARSIRSLDGVTGRITLEDGYRFQRELTPAQFVGSEVQPLTSPLQ